MVHPPMTTTIVVALLRLVHTVQEATGNAPQEERDHLHTMNTMTEVMHVDRLLPGSHTHPHQEDMKNHMIAGLLLLLLEGTILMPVEILMPDPEVHLLLEVMAAMVAVVVATAVTMIDDIR